jgi:hypothetical protein
LFYSGSTLRDIELELTREEQEQEHVSAVVQDAAEDTMTEYLMLGLEIEGLQCVFHLVEVIAVNSPFLSQTPAGRRPLS